MIPGTRKQRKCLNVRKVTQTLPPFSLRGLRRCSFRGWGGRLKERFVRGFVRYLKNNIIFCQTELRIEVRINHVFYNKCYNGECQK